MNIPQRYKKYLTKDVEKMITAEPDSHLRELYRDNMIQFIDVFQGSRYSLKRYIDAVKFCTHRLLGNTQVEAFEKAFPKKCRNWRIEKRSALTFEQAASNYSRTKMVTKIMERSLVPVYILNMDLHQEAINVQAQLMRTAKSEMVRMKAAECLIHHLKQPEEQKIAVEVNHRSEALEELKRVTRELAVNQRKAIESKSVEVIDVAESQLVGSTSSDRESKEGEDLIQ